MAKLARALAAVHATGLIHRDLKTNNVMIDQRGEPILMDFGLARPADGESALLSTDPMVGAPPFISPEQINGEPATAASDIYSLGVTFYHILTGELPFQSPRLVHKIVMGESRRPRSLSPEIDAALEGICLKAMALKPADRYRSAAEMKEALERYLATPPASPPRRRLWRLGAVAAGAALAGVLLLGVLISILTPEGELVVEIDPQLGKDVQVTVSQGGRKIQLVDAKSGWTLSLSAGRYELSVKGSDDQFQLDSDSVTVTPAVR